MHTKLALASAGDNKLCACPAACGALIAAMNSHPFCVLYMGLKHTEEAIDFNCSHCQALPKKHQGLRLKVAVTQSVDFGQSDSDRGNSYDGALPGISRGAASLSRADKGILLPSRASYLVKPPSLMSRQHSVMRTTWAF